MRYPAAEKIEIIRLVEQSNLSVRRTLEQIGVPRATFYRWYDQYQTGGPEALEDRPGRPSRVWNRIPEEVRAAILEMALEHSELSPRELAARFTDSQGYFVSEARIDRSHMGKIERGERNVTLLNVLRIATAMHCRPSEILADAGL